MSDSDSDSDDGDLFAPVAIGGVDMLVTEEEALAPSADSIESDAEPETPKKAKKLQAPDSWGSRHFSQESDALPPSQDAPGSKRASPSEKKAPPNKKKKTSRDENYDDDFEARGQSQASSCTGAASSQGSSQGAAKEAKAPKAKKLEEVRTPGPPKEALQRFEEDPEHAEVADFVWLHLKFALHEAQLAGEHKTTWWPARRVSAHKEKTWLDSLDLRISALDEQGGVSLYMLFDPQNSLVAVPDKCGASWRPFDYEKGKSAAQAARAAGKGKRSWSKVLVQDLETDKAGHTVLKKDARAMVKRAKQWLKRTLKAANGGENVAGGSSDDGQGALSSSEEEDWEAAAAAGRQRLQRLHEATVREEDLLPEVLQAGDVIEYHDPRAVKDLSKDSRSRRTATVLDVRLLRDASASGYAPLVLSNGEGAALTVESELRRRTHRVKAPALVAVAAAPEPPPAFAAALPSPPPAGVRAAALSAAFPAAPTRVLNPRVEWQRKQAALATTAREAAKRAAASSARASAGAPAVASATAMPAAAAVPLVVPAAPVPAVPTTPAFPAAPVPDVPTAPAFPAAPVPAAWREVEATGAVWRRLRTFTLVPGRGDPSLGLASNQQRNAAAMKAAAAHADGLKQAVHDRIFNAHVFKKPEGTGGAGGQAFASTEFGASRAVVGGCAACRGQGDDGGSSGSSSGGDDSGDEVLLKRESEGAGLA